jgi:hypothetical protein
MTECEDFFGLFTTRICSWKDSHHVGQFERVELLRDWDSCLQTLRSISIHFIPTYLTGERHHIVSVWVWNKYSALFQELRCGIQAFRTEFIISKRSKQFTHKNISLNISL